MSLGSKLKILRQKKGESLQQVANSVGISKAHVWEMEKGSSSNPGIELLTRLAKHFNVSVAYLIDDNSETSDAAALQFFRQFEGKLSDDDWITLQSIADRLKRTKNE